MSAFRHLQMRHMEERRRNPPLKEALLPVALRTLKVTDEENVEQLIETAVIFR